VNRIAEWILALRRVDLDALERVHYAESLAAADPRELDDANRAIEASQSRTA
jgi:hypothetical protein